MRCIVYSTDGNSLDLCHLTWSLRSLYRYSAVPFDTVILSDHAVQIPDSVVELSRDHGKFIQLDGAVSVLADHGITRSVWRRRWPFEVLYRLAVPLLPDVACYDDAIYLDTDVLVLSPRVDQFIEADIGSHEFGGIPDAMLDASPRVSRLLDGEVSPEIRTELERRIGKIASRSYINAGVLKLNLATIRADRDWYSRRLVSLSAALDSGKLAFNDQDFINAETDVDSGFSRLFNFFIPGGGESPHCVIHHYCGHSYRRMAARAVKENLI